MSNCTCLYCITVQFCRKENRDSNIVLCDAGVGAHGEGFTIPDVLRGDFGNLFVHTHHTEVLVFCVLDMQQSLKPLFPATT